MATPPGVSTRSAADGCAELRQTVSVRCEEAHLAAQAQAAASDLTRARKRDLVAAQRQVDTAVAAADPAQRRADKAAARDAYLLASKMASNDAALMDATATWAGTIDRINRQGRLAARAVTRARAQAALADEALQAAQRDEQTLRFRAESAEAACLEGRVRLASCEEDIAGPGSRVDGARATDAGAGGPTVRRSEAADAEPLVIEAIVEGDEEALELAAVAIADHGVLSPAEASLQLRELVDAVLAAGGEEGYLVFDASYPLWADLTADESRDVVGALTRLGFQLDPREGWHAGRQPTPADLAMALGYAGLDIRHMRTLPAAVDVAAMPASIGVDARAFLADRAPGLAVDQLVRLLGPRATALGSLWDAWGQVRPVLFSQRGVVAAAGPGAL